MSETSRGARDIYSLACVLYEMLGGRPPFEAATVRALLAKHVTEQPLSIRALRPEVRSTVDQALIKALAKDPARRFPTVAEFVSALGAPTPDVRRSAGKTKSVAVLPFVNAGPDPDNEYLSDGITDELINALAKVEGLRLASRTSVFALKGKAQDVRAIGVLLGASVVLEGTVRRSGDQLRITAQLTSTDDGQLLWSQRYNRQLSDVFAVEDEIARTIVNTLRATWFADLVEPLTQRYTDNVKAYAHYLRGPPRVEQAHPGGRARGGGAFRARDGRGSEVRSGLHWPGRLVCAAGRLPERSGKGWLRAGEDVREAGDRTRRFPGRGACVAGVEHVHLRLGLERGRPRISPGDRSQSAIRDGPAVVRFSAGVAGTPRRRTRRGPRRVRARPGLGIRASQPRPHLLLCSPVRSGGVPH